METTTPYDDMWILRLGQGTFDMESCYFTLKNECSDVETPLYWAMSYAFVGVLFIAFFSNLFVMSLYIRGHHEFKKVRFVSKISRGIV